MQNDLQPTVANAAISPATLCSVGAESKNYWRDVCAPKLRAAKERAGGRKLSQEDIASYVESNTDKPSGRALVGHFLTGEREPYFSQFIALCRKLGVDPAEVLETGKREKVPLATVNERAAAIPPVITGRRAKKSRR